MALDASNIPSDSSNIRIYYAIKNGSTNGIQVWEKPRGTSSIFILGIGAGGGGGGGFQAANGTSKGGGGSGASGVITKVFSRVNLVKQLRSCIAPTME